VVTTDDFRVALGRDLAHPGRDVLEIGSVEERRHLDWPLAEHSRAKLGELRDASSSVVALAVPRTRSGPPPPGR